jgi:hypothetical protein
VRPVFSQRITPFTIPSAAEEGVASCAAQYALAWKPCHRGLNTSIKRRPLRNACAKGAPMEHSSTVVVTLVLLPFTRRRTERVLIRNCSVAKTPVYPQVPAHAPIWLNLCMPLLGLPAGCGTPLRNRAIRNCKAWFLKFYSSQKPRCKSTSNKSASSTTRSALTSS